MIDLDLETVVDLPVDELGLRILPDLVASEVCNERSYALGAQQGPYAESPLACDAIVEALGWLRARGLTAHNPADNEPSSVFVTRMGHRVIDEGPDAFYATERLQRGLHPAIERTARPQFLMGRYDLGVFDSMKAVEVRVRALAEFGDDMFGVDLMNRAFGPTGPLVDASATTGERDGTRALFAGAYQVLRNPAGHREVDYGDVAEAAEAVQTASLLMRMLDRVEQRIKASTT
jgi:uncharacterized protein (TIGR02391 family)